ncbi:hypothetical protein N656DRAFT_796726 [Canariomyces notabilis]|uniref:Uncharacterized protein n=1 Tax=Canariomyces notabilis TaxID=2074819 RepID=A0AAN6TH02_9PEZI|nr:hypothetical protein N656DRAFT_796726 [Canariomyces arenarius]
MAEGFCTLQESFERFARLAAESQDLSHDRRAQGGRGFWEALQNSLLNGIIIIFVAFEFVIPPSTHDNLRINTGADNTSHSLKTELNRLKRLIDDVDRKTKARLEGHRAHMGSFADYMETRTASVAQYLAGICRKPDDERPRKRRREDTETDPEAEEERLENVENLIDPPLITRSTHFLCVCMVADSRLLIGSPTQVSRVTSR